jgi:hypothetical protein
MFGMPADAMDEEWISGQLAGEMTHARRIHGPQHAVLYNLESVTPESRILSANSTSEINSSEYSVSGCFL